MLIRHAGRCHMQNNTIGIGRTGRLLLFYRQIQIQIESLHTRLDESGEMTNAASLYSRTFSQHVYDERAPRDAGGFSFALSTRQALDQGRRAPIAH